MDVSTHINKPGQHIGEISRSLVPEKLLSNGIVDRIRIVLHAH